MSINVSDGGDENDNYHVCEHGDNGQFIASDSGHEQIQRFNTCKHCT